MRATAQETGPPDNSQKLLQRGKGKQKINIEDFGEGGVQRNHRLTLQEAFC